MSTTKVASPKVSKLDTPCLDRTLPMEALPQSESRSSTEVLPSQEDPFAWLSTLGQSHGLSTDLPALDNSVATLQPSPNLGIDENLIWSFLNIPVVE